MSGADALISAFDPANAPKLGSFGIELGNRDLSVKPGDDFNRYGNGTWFDAYQLKDYETRYGAFNYLNDRAEEHVRTIIEELQSRTDLAPGSKEQKVRDFYASYMDQAARDDAGIAPLKPVLDRIAGIDSLAKLTAAFGSAEVDGTNAPVGADVGLDRKDPNSYLVGIGVAGLGLPDKDFYFNPDARFVTIRAAYLEHIQKMFGLRRRQRWQGPRRGHPHPRNRHCQAALGPRPAPRPRQDLQPGVVRRTRQPIPGI